MENKFRLFFVFMFRKEKKLLLLHRKKKNRVLQIDFFIYGVWYLPNMLLMALMQASCIEGSTFCN